MSRALNQAQNRSLLKTGYPVPPPYGLYSRIKFGEHIGEWVSDIIADDPGYIRWCLDNVQGFTLTPEAMAELELSER